MQPFNIFAAQPTADETNPPGYQARMSRFGAEIGAELIGGTVYELPPGQSNCPYHYDLGDEEWLIVLQGRPTVRLADGSHQLEPGDTLCFRRGPDGAHKITNATSETVRTLMISTKRKPSVAVFPDSDKVSVITDDASDSINAPRLSGVDYWDGE